MLSGIGSRERASPIKLRAAVESSAIVIALTGSSYTTGAANDVVATWFEVNAMN